MNNSDNPNPYLINRYGGAPNRITRTNQNTTPSRLNNHPRNQAKQVQQPQSPTKVKESQDSFKNLLPNKVSQLSPNVIFQGMDNQAEQSKPFEPIKRSQKPLQRKVEAPAPVIDQRTSMGVLTNAYMGSTTKYQKMKIDINTLTPSKGEESQTKSPRHSQTSSQQSGIKFARRRGQDPKRESVEVSAQSSPRKEKGEQVDSYFENHSRIQRRPAGSRQPLKHHEVKEADRSEDKFQSSSSRVDHHNKSQTSRDHPTNATEQEASQIKPPVAQRPYRPIQRQNQSQNKSEIVTPRNEVTEEAAISNPQTINRRPYQNRGLNNNKPASQITPTKPEEPVAEQQQTTKAPISRINRYGSNKPVYSAVKKQQNVRQSIQGGQSQTGSRLVTPNKAASDAPSPLSKRGAVGSKRQSEANSLAGSKVTEKINLKKTSAILYIIKRILATQLLSSFFIFKKQLTSMKVKLTVQASILASSCGLIVQNKKHNAIKFAFDQLKRKFTTDYIHEVKPMLTVKLGNPNQSGINILHNFFTSKVRAAFKVLNNKFVASNRIKGIIHLEHFVKSKDHSLQKISIRQLQRQAQNRIQHFDQCFKILGNYWKMEMLRGFILILSFQQKQETVKPEQKSLRKEVRPISSISQEQPNPALIEKRQKLQAISASLYQNISKIEKQLQEAKAGQNDVRLQSDQKITILKEQNSLLQVDLTDKRNRNEEISKQISHLSSARPEPQQIEEAFEYPSQKLEVLTNIYIGNYKQQNIKREQLFSQYNLIVDDSNSLVNEWTLLKKNTELKKIISKYQKVEQVESKARRTVMNEQQMVLKLVRSYIKQQYFWQWLHVSVQSL